MLEELTSMKVELMAWPYGECNDELEELSDEAEYRASWSVWKGRNSRHSLWRVPLGDAITCRVLLPRYQGHISR